MYIRTGKGQTGEWEKGRGEEKGIREGNWSRWDRLAREIEEVEGLAGGHKQRKREGQKHKRE
jgi:hypothetical protein